jgi:hypothetical protein
VSAWSRRPAALVAAFGLGCASAWGAALPLHTCRLVGLDHDAQCGVLKRPLDPARPDGTQIDLHVVVVPRWHARSCPTRSSSLPAVPARAPSAWPERWSA